MPSRPIKRAPVGRSFMGNETMKGLLIADDDGNPAVGGPALSGLVIRQRHGLATAMDLQIGWLHADRDQHIGHRLGPLQGELLVVAALAGIIGVPIHPRLVQPYAKQCFTQFFNGLASLGIERPHVVGKQHPVGQIQRPPSSVR